MEKLHTKEEVRRLTWMLAITYMISYMTRINFGAIISEMSDATGIAKSDLSISLTGSFVFYGVGQLISGFLGDRVSPKRLVSLGLGCSAVMNFLLPHCQNSFLMMVIWCVNGLAQAFLWPPIVRIMTQKLSAEDYKQAVTRVSWGSSAGTILIYLLSPVLTALLSAALTGCMHGVNLMLVCMIPQFFTKYGNTSLVSDILNACTYVGSACSTYAIAAVSEQKGWYVTVLLWFCIALLGAILCLCSRNYWRKHFMTELPDLEERK